MNEPTPEAFHNVCFVWTGGPGDEVAFERALQLCEKSEAALSVVGVVESPPAGLLRFMESLGVGFESTGDEAVRSEQFVEAARRRQVRAVAENVGGPAAVEIVRKVQRCGHDLLVKAAQPCSAFHHLLYGNTDRQLVRQCPCPVWVEHPSSRASRGRVLAAVDPTPFRDDPDFDPAREELNAAILQAALRIARLEGAELHVVHVWQFFLEQRLMSRAGLSDEKAAEVGEASKRLHEQALADLLGPFMPQVARVHCLKGQPADEIADLVSREAIDVLVMGTVCRTGTAGWFVGNTAETLLNRIECSLVALKPRGFVSPVPPA